MSAQRAERGVRDDAIQVFVRTSVLTDGSEVSDIHVGGYGGAVFHCVTARDAETFLAGFRALVGAHTLDVLRVRAIGG